MLTEEITIRVDPQAAKTYRQASEEERRKFDLVLSLSLRDVSRPGTSLKQLMHEISSNAQERGLTPEILKAILDES